ncbi:transporter substrate-binding domain-containing protein [Castellaniella sp. GW247-6E4]|uniref:transporter substrate-binding domain-containing protein n=1 Tax=Castellaniella sp. GW247-6E4 TaxID=3140380 RepID=UPI0033152088
MKKSASFRPVSGTRRLLLSAVAAMALGTAFTPSAQAQSVDAVKASGVLKAGVQVAQVPWGFTDAQGQLTGFEVEFVRMVAKDLGVQPQIVPVTPANRTAALLTGQVDMLAAVMGIFPDRQKVVLFSRPYAVNENVVIAKAGPQMQGWEGLKGMRVGVPRGTPQDKALTDANLPDTKLMRFDDDAATVQALISGQVDAIGAAITQVGNLAQVAGPGKYESRLVLSRVYNGAAVRPGEREWADYLNDVIGRKIADGELSALYKKWIGNDLPADMPDTGEGDAPLPAIVTK